VLATGAEGRAERLDHAPRLPLEVLQLLPVSGQQAVDRKLGSGGRVLHDLSGPRGSQPLLDETPEYVVDPLTGEAGLARDLGGGEGVPAEQRQVRLRLVARQPQAGELLNRAAVAGHHRRDTSSTHRGVNTGVRARSMRPLQQQEGDGAVADGVPCDRAR
jgi:hypothetical protein